jgi:hypothetical protein
MTLIIHIKARHPPQIPIKGKRWNGLMDGNWILAGKKWGKKEEKWACCGKRLLLEAIFWEWEEGWREKEGGCRRRGSIKGEVCLGKDELAWGDDLRQNQCVGPFGGERHEEIIEGLWKGRDRREQGEDEREENEWKQRRSVEKHVRKRFGRRRRAG